ncbi:MAG: Fe2+-dependent dioxygenase [Lysobacterales bacterium]
MLLIIDTLLDASCLRVCRERLEEAEWQDGRVTAGTLSASVKHNEQLDSGGSLAIELGQLMLRSLSQHPQFLSAALPQTLHPPRFNRYRNGGHYGTHVDAAVMRIDPRGPLLRSDLSATIFLSEPEEYEGGELVIETEFGAQEVKLAAGAMVLYPSSSLHQVRPVNGGARIAAILWLQSLVRDPGARALLYELDQTAQKLGAEFPADDPRLLSLTAIYHNLLRRWSEP